MARGMCKRVNKKRHTGARTRQRRTGKCPGTTVPSDELSADNGDNGRNDTGTVCAKPVPLLLVLSVLRASKLSVLAVIPWSVFVVVAAATLLFAQTRQHRVVGCSMGDALPHGRIIRVIRIGRCLRRLYPFQAGDIVTFVPNERAREAAGLAGLQQRTGTPVFVKWVKWIDEQGCFFVEGDARQLSCDSHDFGVIGLESIVGVLPIALQ